MPEPSERSKPVLAWRQKNREEGLRPLTAWVPVEVKFHLEDLASQRRQTVGEVIAEALHAWQPGKSSATTSHLEQLIRKEVTAQLRRQRQPTHSASPPPLPAVSPREPQAPVAVADEPSSPAPRPAPPADDTPQSTPASKERVEARILELHTQGYSNRHIAAVLNDEGVPTFQGGHWRQGTIGKMVHRLQRQAAHA